MDWSTLPNEILHNIFQRLNQESNSHCSRVCRQWRDPARCFFFEKLVIYNREHFDSLPSAFSVYQDRSSSANFGQSPANFVKILDFFVVDKITDIKALHGILPFLEIIQTPDSDELHENLYASMMEGKFPLLKVIPASHLSRPPPELILLRKEHLEQVHIRIIDSSHKIIYQKLHLFPKLKVIVLECREKDLSDEMHFEKLFPNQIPLLESIFFRVPHFPDIIKAAPLDLNCIQPLQNVKEIETRHCGIPYTGNKSLLYMMKKFPNLDALEMNDKRGETFAPCDGIVSPMDCLPQFLRWLFEMKKGSKISYVATNQYTSEIVEGFFKNVVEKGPVIEKTEINLTVIFQAVPQGYDHYNSPDDAAYLEVINQKAGHDNYYDDRCFVSVAYKVMPTTTLHSHLELFQKAEIVDINRLEIKFKEYEGHSFTLGSNVPLVLDVIFQHFPALKEFVLKDVTNITCLDKDRSLDNIVNQKLEVITLEGCKLPGNVFPWISSSCLNLNMLNLVCCGTEDLYSRLFPVLMPSTTLDQLNIIFYFDETSEYKKLFIRLTTSNKKPRYCKIVVTYDPPKLDFPKENYTENDFNLCLDDEEYTVYDIHCEAVKILIVDAEAAPFYEESVDYYDPDNEEGDLVQSREYFEEIQ